MKAMVFLCFVMGLIGMPMAFSIKPQSVSSKKGYLLPILPKHKVNSYFQKAKKGFEARWKKFSKKRKFMPFNPNLTDAEIEENLTNCAI